VRDLVPEDRIQQRIFEVRGKKVMLDRDLAELYGVGTKVLNQAVRRNQERFPDGFAFQLTPAEVKVWMPQSTTSRLRSQIVTSNRGGTRYLPTAFTEHGILMLSNVLHSERAVKVSIQIIRVFVQLRGMVQGYQDLIERVQKIERRQDAESREIWKAVTLLQKALLK